MIKVKCGDDLAAFQEQAFGCTPDFCALRGKQKYNLLARAPRDLISLCDTRAPEDTKCYFASTELDLFIIIHEIASIWKF